MRAAEALPFGVRPLFLLEGRMGVCVLLHSWGVNIKKLK